MNKERRKKISQFIENLRMIHEGVELLADEEREAFENMPENLRKSENEEQLEELESVPDVIMSAIEHLTEVIGGE
jgi:hypothetical protein